VVISSESESRSLDVAEVLRAAVHLQSATYIERFEYWNLAQDEQTRCFNDARQGGKGSLSWFGTTGIIEASELAVRLFSRACTRTAALRYLASIEAAHLPYHMARPEADAILLSNYSEADRVRFANAATLAYTAIEDLGLEIRASSSKPSRINGSWNAAVFDELKERLRASGVGPETRVIWHRRTPPTKIERLARPIGDQERPSWSGGHIRDVLISVAEAVALCSTIRSKASAHGRASLGRSLSVYDVTNIQSTARALLLEIANEGRQTNDLVLSRQRAEWERKRSKRLKGAG
jgi:hypothetical protein